MGLCGSKIDPPNMLAPIPMEQTSASRFCVVLNDEEQYSIWPVGRDIPAGWRTAGVEGTREECLSHIGTVWTDITPKSARQRVGDRQL